MKGVSIIICCYNSESKIAKTLGHISKQKTRTNVLWETILVNNASADNTKAVCESTWNAFKNPNPFYIVDQPVPGLIAARKKGISKARYDYIVFCDDDNWLSPDYIQTAFEIFEENPNIGVCGGYNTPVSDVPLPFWFERFHRSYATGEQGTGFGKAKYGVVFGAGMTVRRKALIELQKKRYALFQTGRKGKKLLAGEDYEICTALRIMGWDIYYSPILKLKHFLPANRLRWKYLRKMLNQVGYSEPGLLAYQHFLMKKYPGRGKIIKFEWQREIIDTLKPILKSWKKFISMFFIPIEGDEEILSLERYRGRIRRLFEMRSKYDKMIMKLWDVYDCYILK